MELVNRAILIVKPKQPFLDWANGTEGPEYDSNDPFIYLVRELRRPTECHALPGRGWVQDSHSSSSG